jgi:hypothetical protein
MPLHEVSRPEPQPFYPGYEWSYNQITSNVSITGNVEGSANTVITCSAVTFDGAPVVVEFFTSRFDAQATAGTSLVVLLQEGATVIGRLAVATNPASASWAIPLCLKYRFTPTAASHTYSITAFTTTGSATVEAGSGGSGQQLPAYVRITKA